MVLGQVLEWDHQWLPLGKGNRALGMVPENFNRVWCVWLKSVASHSCCYWIDFFFDGLTLDPAIGPFSGDLQERGQGLNRYKIWIPLSSLELQTRVEAYWWSGVWGKLALLLPLYGQPVDFSLQGCHSVTRTEFHFTKEKALWELGLTQQPTIIHHYSLIPCVSNVAVYFVLNISLLVCLLLPLQEKSL